MTTRLHNFTARKRFAYRSRERVQRVLRSVRLRHDWRVHWTPRVDVGFEENTIDVMLVLLTPTDGIDPLWELSLAVDLPERASSALDWLLPDHRVPWTEKSWCSSRRPTA